ncbi:MAG TPA: sensor histidine kinase [Candidatus Nanopelagicaceae bacterium]|nr:sensor histidine kinase [Candidatus Nanopelagicaceae bacterium]
MAIASGPGALDALSLAGAELRALEHLGMAATSGTDLDGVQDCIVTALNEGLGLEGATVGLVDEAQGVVGNWRGSPGETLAMDPQRFLPIADGGAAELAFSIPGRLVHTQFGESPCAIAAACYRGEPLGLLAVSIPPEGLGPPLAAALERFTTHAAESLAGVRMCVDRTRRLAVEAERTRISIDMHDAVIQSLFAIGCTLEGCVQATDPGDPEQARRLDECRRLVEKTLRQVRQSIYDLWPAELLERQFLSQLRQHLAELTGSPPALEWEARGQLADLPGEARHTLLAVAQEALTNVVRHAGARHVRVVLDTTCDPVQLRVSDDGVGLPQDDMKPQFGIRGMRARLLRLGGRLQITSEPGLGTILHAELPRHPALRASLSM